MARTRRGHGSFVSGPLYYPDVGEAGPHLALTLMSSPVTGASTVRIMHNEESNVCFYDEALVERMERTFRDGATALSQQRVASTLLIKGQRSAAIQVCRQTSHLPDGGLVSPIVMHYFTTWNGT